jgi:hypothetical protein
MSEILQAQIARLIAENERLRLKQRWVIEFQTEIAGLQDQLAAKQSELDDAQDKIAGFMEATAPQQIKIEDKR